MSRPPNFGTDELIAAFEEIGRAASAHGTRLELSVFDGSALMLASNFRFSTDDVDIAALDGSWPDWLSRTVTRIAAVNGWSEDWLNDAVTFHLSPLAGQSSDHLEFGSFPRDREPGLLVFIPKPEYLLALKLKAMRLLDPVKGRQEARDIHNLMRVLGVDQDAALALLTKYFPKSGQDLAKQRFLLRHMVSLGLEDGPDAPRYLG